MIEPHSQENLTNFHLRTLVMLLRDIKTWVAWIGSMAIVTAICAVVVAVVAMTAPVYPK